MKSSTRNKYRVHFDSISQNYDFFKEKNQFYYQSVKDLILNLISNPDDSKILEVGCGTGDILSYLNPKKGLGIDVSEGMINRARKKFSNEPNLIFKNSSLEDLKVNESFDYILLIDVLEHLDDVDTGIEKLKDISRSDSKVILLTANPHWSLILHVLEKMKLKMPEGPHKWVSLKELEPILQEKGFRITGSGYRLLIPIHIPLISRVINSCFHNLPLIRRLGLIQYLMAHPA